MMRRQAFRRRWTNAVRLGGAACLIAAATTALSGQGAAATAVRFDVTSVKPNRSGTLAQRVTTPGPGRFVAINVTVEDLVAEAFRKQASQIVNLPPWTKSRRFDVQGTTDEAADWSRLMQMLQRLLADRFKVAAHGEVRDAPAYALVVDRNGPRFQPVPENSCTPGEGGCGGFSNAPGRVIGRRVTTAQLARILSGPRTGRVVTDRTGLSGYFSFELTWAPDPGSADVNAPPPIEPSAGSIFTAVRDQLGLRLEPATVPTDMLVIDRIAEPEPD